MARPATRDPRETHFCSSTVCLDDLAAPPHRLMVVTDDDRSAELAAIRRVVADAARGHDATVVLYDLSAAGTLTNPYPHFAGAEWRHALDGPRLQALGRGYLLPQIAAFQTRGVPAQAVIPEHHSFAHLADWAERERIDLIILPAKWAHPAFRDRLRGHSLTRLLDHTGVPVAIYEADGSAWLATPDGAPGLPAS